MTSFGDSKIIDVNIRRLRANPHRNCVGMRQQMERIKIKKHKREYLQKVFSCYFINNINLRLYDGHFVKKKYNYNDIEELLKNQINIAINFMKNIFQPLPQKKIFMIMQIYFGIKQMQEVQIFNMNGELLMDSIGVNDNNIDSYPDIKNIINNKAESGRWIGEKSYYDYSVMSVSKPININGKNIGIIRYTISLKSVDESIKEIVFTIYFLYLYFQY